MVRVQHQEHVQGMRLFRRRLELAVRQREHHVEEVLGVGEVGPRVGDRLPDVRLVGGSGDRACLGDQRGSGPAEARLVRDVDLGEVVGLDRIDHGRQHRHGVRVDGEPVEVLAHVAVKGGVLGQQVTELFA